MKKIFLLGLVGVFMCACATNNNLNGTWQLKNDKTISLSIENNRIFGFLGVNNFNGFIKTKQNSLKIDNLIKTLMAGAPKDMENEDKMLKILQNATSYKLNENLLILSMDENNFLEFTRFSLKNTSWKLSAIFNENAITSTKFQANLNFGDNEINGFSGVNRFMATLNQNNGKLEIKNLASTKMAGNEKAMEFEQKFLSLLEQSEKYDIIGKNLELKSKNGQVLLVFIMQN